MTSMPRRLLTLSLAPLLALASVGAAGGQLLGSGSHRELLPRIVNGVETFDDPEVVAVLANGFLLCSGTLIGCDHVLTAGHCASGISPASLEVFGQTFGLRSVQATAVHPDFVFTQNEVHGDLAVLTLGEPVTGVAPAPINTAARVPHGSEGRLVGYGSIDGASQAGAGLKREGLVTTGPCEGVDEDEFLCWTFAEPVGLPGEDSNTCNGDSGGPLFAQVQGQRVLAGLTSGGNFSCQPEDHPFDADVFVARDWIADQVGAGLGGGSCTYGAAGTEGNPIFTATAQLSVDNEEERFFVDVPAGVNAVRFTLNGAEDFPNDFDLFVKRGELAAVDYEAVGNFNDCASFRTGTFEGCSFVDPAPGRYHILAHRYDGGGAAQVTATIHGGPASGCLASATTMCLAGGRFEVEVQWEDFEGNTGPGQVVPGGTADSGLFWFFSPDNWEQLIKVIDGCTVNDRYWVFAAATTNVGYTLTVTDTANGTERQYANPLGVSAPALTDTDAFATCP